MAFDAGTNSTRAILFDRTGNIVSMAAQEFCQIYPKPGWVEPTTMAIWNTQISVAQQALTKAGASPEDVAAVGITNQRETTVVWEKATGKPLMNAIVWQDRRTAGICDDMKARGLTDYVRENTGLVVDAYFSGTKIKWMLDNIPGARARAEKGELLFGTVDTWLIWNLTGGQAHVTDYSNASRTLLFNIQRCEWDDRLLDELTVQRQMLPRLRPSSDIYGMTDEQVMFGCRVPVAAAIGDKQGALFGQACFKARSEERRVGKE